MREAQWNWRYRHGPKNFRHPWQAMTTTGGHHEMPPERSDRVRAHPTEPDCKCDGCQIGVQIDRKKEHVHSCLECGDTIGIGHATDCEANTDHDFGLCDDCSISPMCDCGHALRNHHTGWAYGLECYHCEVCPCPEFNERESNENEDTNENVS